MKVYSERYYIIKRKLKVINDYLELKLIINYNIQNVKDPTLKAILKYEKHPSILAIRTKSNRNSAFSLKGVIVKEIETEIRL